LLNMSAIALPVVIFILTLIGLYKMFIKKVSITPFYTPFDEITGQTPIVFHQEHEVIAEDEDQGDGKNRNKKSPM
jgi:hypothetical protein